MVVCPQCKSSFNTEEIGGHYEECVVKTIKGKRAESKSRLGKEKKQGWHPYFTLADFSTALKTKFVILIMYRVERLHGPQRLYPEFYISIYDIDILYVRKAVANMSMPI